MKSRASRFPRRRLGVLLLVLGLFFAWTARAPAPGPAMPLPDSEAARRIAEALPPDLAPLRRAFVERGAALIGRVGYFWGGKSDVLGWDGRWGAPAVVTAPGGADTGRSLPFGLDCSGFVSWCAVNAAEDPAAFARIGNGVREQYALCAPVDWDGALPGDLVFYQDLSHVGVVAGWSPEGTLMVLHCSRSLGGVVCSPDAQAAGFAEVGRPEFYQLEQNEAKDT